MTSESMADKLVTIIIPCYNQAQFLPEAVACVQNQTHTNWECIIVYRESADNTSEVARELARNDARVRCVAQTNRGLAAARNVGLEVTNGQYVQFLDADDTIDERKLELQLAAIPDPAELVVSFTDYTCYSVSPGIEVPEGYHDPDLDTADPLLDMARRFGSTLGIPVHSFLFDARFFTEHGIRFDEELVSCEDFACWLRVFRLEPTVVWVDEKLARYRWHAASMSQDKARMWQGFRLALIKSAVEFRDNVPVSQALADRVGLPRQYICGEMNSLGRARVKLGLMRSAIASKLIPGSVRRAIKRRLRG